VEKWFGNWVIIVVVLFAGEANPDSLQPSPGLSPPEVVRLQIEALGHNNVPYENAGIETAFRFASPANKSVTGPLDRFIQMVSSPAYRPMLNYQEAEYGETVVEEDQAMQPVILTAKNGEQVGYVFHLSKQEGDPCDACWMTDGVIRFETRGKQKEPMPTI